MHVTTYNCSRELLGDFIQHFSLDLFSGILITVSNALPIRDVVADTNSGHQQAGLIGMRGCQASRTRNDDWGICNVFAWAVNHRDVGQSKKDLIAAAMWGVYTLLPAFYKTGRRGCRLWQLSTCLASQNALAEAGHHVAGC